nr:MAG TPA: hypothetical protein [Caudoviricetes sp.]
MCLYPCLNLKANIYYYDKETLDRIFGVLLKFKGTSD